MYIMINDIKDEKRIDLSYPIYPKKEIAAVSMLSNNAQYWLQGSIEMLFKKRARKLENIHIRS